MKELIKALRKQSFGLAILACAAVSFAFPSCFDTWGGVKLTKLVSPAIQVIMFGMGTTLALKGEGSVGVIYNYGTLQVKGGTIEKIYAMPVEPDATGENNSVTVFEDDYNPGTKVPVFHEWNPTGLFPLVMRLASTNPVQPFYMEYREFDGVIYRTKYISGLMDDTHGVSTLDFAHKLSVVSLDATGATFSNWTGLLHLESAGDIVAEEDVLLSFKVNLEEGYENPVVTINDATITPDEDGVYSFTPTRETDRVAITVAATKIYPQAEVVELTPAPEDFDFALEYTAANEAPLYDNETASFVLSANKAIPADAVQIGGKFATMDWNIYNLPAIDANTEYTITEATWTQVKAISPFTCGAASIALTEDTEITLTLKLGEAVVDKRTVTLKAKAIEPVDPEESKSYDTEKEAQDAADKMNGEDGTVKPEFINAPEGITSDAAKAEYAKLFKAVADGKTVTVQLTEAAQIAIKTELANAENEQTILEPDEDGKATIAAKPGLYYGIVAEDSLDKMATAEGKNWVMATDTTVKVTVPEVKDAEGTRAKAAFFRPTCSVKNPRK